MLTLYAQYIYISLHAYKQQLHSVVHKLLCKERKTQHNKLLNEVSIILYYLYT